MTIFDYFEYTQHIPLSLLNAGISLFIFGVSYRRRNDIRGGRVFLILIFGLMLRALAVIPNFANTNLDNLLFWQNTQWVMNNLLVTLWLVFALYYSGRIQRLSAWLGITLSIVPILTVVVILLDSQLGFIRSDVNVIIYQGLPMLDSARGAFYDELTAYNYIIAIVATLLVFQFLFSSPGIYRQQAIVFLVTIILILVIFMIQSNGDIHPAITPQLIILIAQIVIVLGILRSGNFKFHPVARPLLMLAMSDAFILYDHYYRISDLNDSAAAILGRPKPDLVGQSVYEVLEPMPAVLTMVQTESEEAAIDVVINKQSDVPQHFQVSLFRIQDRGEVSRCIVLHDVTMQKQAEVERIKNLENETRIQVMTHFINSASHDLKHPLTNIGVRLYMLEKGLSDENHLRHVEVIKQQNDKLQDILDDMFLLMRLESNRDIEMLRMSVDDLLMSIERQYQQQFKQHNIELIVTSKPIFIVADYQLLTKALTHLLDNTLAYTQAGGTVSIAVEQHEHVVNLVVKDTGDGIPSDELQHIIDPFYRADASRNSSVGGAGIGLTLVQRIMRVHSGTLDIQSEVDVGTQATLSIPMTTQAVTPSFYRQ